MPKPNGSPENKVYCAGCRWLIDDPTTCLFSGNIGERIVESWLGTQVLKVLLQTPIEKNQDNDCPDYE